MVYCNFTLVYYIFTNGAAVGGEYLISYVTFPPLGDKLLLFLQNVFSVYTPPFILQYRLYSPDCKDS